MAVAGASPDASIRDVAVRLAEHGVNAARAYGRADLATRLTDLRDRAADPTIRVLVAGEFKQGKSSLVNALVGSDVCPVDDDVATAVATAVRYASQPSAAAIVLGEAGDGDRALLREPIDVAALPAWVTESGEQAEAHDVQLVDIGIPASALLGGLVLVDLPGVGGIGSIHGAVTLAALASAQAVLYLTDSAQELTATELDFLRTIAQRSPVVALAETKVDIHPAWRRVVDADAITAAGLAAGPFPVSSELARKALASDDPALTEEAGTDVLLAWLRGEVVAGAAQRDALVVAEAVESVAQQLRQPFEAELATLVNPATAAGIAEHLERLEGELARVRGAAARWQTVFADRFGDLANDLDHDLRTRVRGIVRKAEEALDQLDPAKSWDTYEPQVRRELAHVIGEHYLTLEARVAEVAETVAAVFVEDANALDAWVREATSVEREAELPAGGGSEAVKLPDRKPHALGEQVLTLLRSSYSAAAMAGFLATAIGFPVAAPAVLAVGILLGAKGLRQERERQLLQRRTQAKTAVRAYVDEVGFVVAKDSRDRVRQAQRQLRDFFAARSEELARSATEALQAAREAAQRDESERQARARDVKAELERLAWLVRATGETRDAMPAGGAHP
jgi:hypothetical protein